MKERLRIVRLKLKVAEAVREATGGLGVRAVFDF
jgi:hypothetical protein